MFRSSGPPRSSTRWPATDSRRGAEVTDAAMGERAECFMLNKGPHIAEAISTLDSILTRMQDHHDKKRSLLRRLRAWDHTDPPR